jgi:glucose-fructose oxidoreductase
MTRFNPARRRFIQYTGAAGLLTAAPGSALAGSAAPAGKDRLGVALVGLGGYSTGQLAPALQQTRYCYLAGIVTGSPEKIPEWQERHDIPDGNVYNYENMHTVADNPDIDVIYIVLPPSMHAEYSIIAAEAGKHVWCEKPMAMTEAECRAIIDACNKNKVKLSIGYRLHHEPNTQTVMRFAEEKPFGDIEQVKARAGFHDGRTESHWRQDPAMGGGAMYDMGVYPLNAARYSTGEEPVAVTARHEVHRPDLYEDVDESTYFELTFPSGAVADCATSFYERYNELRVDCQDGWYELAPFQSYTGVQGKTSTGKKLDKKIDDQQTRQMDNDARAIINDTPVRVPGEEGLKDIRVVEAIFRAAETGEKVAISG